MLVYLAYPHEAHIAQHDTINDVHFLSLSGITLITYTDWNQPGC